MGALIIGNGNYVLFFGINFLSSLKRATLFSSESLTLLIFFFHISDPQVNYLVVDMNETRANLIVSFPNKFTVPYRSLILVNSLIFQADVKVQRSNDMGKYKEESVLIFKR